MFYKDYRWSAYPTGDPRVTGKPGSTFLNRQEGYEMVYFIDRYMVSQNLKQKDSGQKIEKFLRDSKTGKQSHADWKKELTNNFKL